MGKRILIGVGKWILYTFGTFLIAYFSITRTEWGERMFRSEVEINEKADKDYVDDRDAALKGDIDENKADNILMHEKDYAAIKDLIDAGQKSNDVSFEHIILLIEAQHDSN